MDEKNNDIERKREAPMSISHSAEMGSNGVSLLEFRACKSNNNLVLLKSLIQKKPQKNSRMKRGCVQEVEGPFRCNLTF